MTLAFISHSNADIQFVREVKKHLQNKGIDSWIAEEKLRAGQRWEREISNALDKCDLFVVAMSPSAIQSEEVKQEVEYAFRNRKLKDKIMPFMLKKCDPDRIHYKLGGLQYINLEPINQNNADNAIKSIEKGKIPTGLIAGSIAGSLLGPLFVPVMSAAIAAAATADE